MGEIKMMHDKHNHLAQETEKAVKEGVRVSNWVLHLKDEKYKVQKEMQKLEHKLKDIIEDLAWLEARKKRVGSFWPEGSNSHIQLSVDFSGKERKQFSPGSCTASLGS